MTSTPTVLHRLYLTLLAVVLAMGSVTVVWIAALHVHDRTVARQDLACYERLLEARAKVAPVEKPWESAPTVAEDDAMRGACSVDRHGRSTRAWEHYGPDVDFSFEELVSLAIAAAAPLALVLLRRWLSWLVSPPNPSSS